MFSVYVLQSLKDGELYVGFTDNLRKRLGKHNAGRVFSTKMRRPLKVIYVEVCFDEQDARAREKYLKTGTGKRFLKYRLKNYFKSAFV